jgi:hypothetical protein
VTDDDRPEVLDLGVVDDAQARPPGPRGAGHQVSRRAVLALGGLAVAGGGAALVHALTSSPARRAEPPGPTPTGPTSTPAPPAPGPPPGDVAVTVLPGPLLGGPKLDVFGFSYTAVVRVELATGRVTRTTLPPLSDTTLWFAAVRSGVLVHRDDGGATYLIADGRGPEPAAPALAGDGPLLPGPDPDHVWVMGGTSSRPALTLVAIDGRPTGTSVELAAFPQYGPVADGGGYPLVAGVGGIYWARPQGPVRVTTGVVLASGPTGWLVLDCDDRDRCSGALVDRTMAHRPVPGVVAADLVTSYPGGAISPDGRTAAFYVGDPTRNEQLVLLDLATGKRMPTDLNQVGGAVTESVAWSPSSRWVFAVDSSARMVAVDAGTGRTTLLVPDTIVPALPVVQQTAVRGAT